MPLNYFERDLNDVTYELYHNRFSGFEKFSCTEFRGYK
jgi:hypothetical protein